MLNAYFFCFFRSFLKLTAYLYLKERRRCLYAAVKRTAAVTVIAAAGNTSMQGKL